MGPRAFRRLAVTVSVGALIASTGASASAARRGAAAHQAEAAQGPLTNADVASMVKAGLPDTVIISAIRRATSRQFDTSPAALVALTKAGASEAVLLEVLGPGRATATAAATPAGTAVGPRRAEPAVAASPSGLPDTPGIYMEEHATPGRYRPLEPTTFSQSKVGGMFATAMTFGLAKSQWRAVVRSANAALRTSDQQPTFYFVFDASGATARPFAGWFAEASSPNEFVLVQMFEKDDRRELIVGEFNAYTANTGTRSKDTVPLTIERISPGLYRVTVAEALGAGEFCFFYASGMPGFQGGQGGRLFDFGVDPAGR